MRYAETNGYERDTDKRLIWRYRDWVVDALNQDLPYDRFVVHQLAGDARDETGADPPRDLGSDRPPSEPRGGPRLPRRRVARRLGEVG